MNYLYLSKNFNLLTNKELCENNHIEQIKVSNYKDLENTLLSYNYDIIPNNILIDVLYNGIVEEALATQNSLILTSDNKKINYDKTKFLIKSFCNNFADIEIIDSKKYCKTCYIDNNQLCESKFEKIIYTLKNGNKTTGISTSKKIQYIVISNSPLKLTARQIYDIGIPWDISGKTPRNTVYARCSSLVKQGLLNKIGTLYFI